MIDFFIKIKIKKYWDATMADLILLITFSISFIAFYSIFLIFKSKVATLDHISADFNDGYVLTNSLIIITLFIIALLIKNLPAFIDM